MVVVVEVAQVMAVVAEEVMVVVADRSSGSSSRSNGSSSRSGSIRASETWQVKGALSHCCSCTHMKKQRIISPLKKPPPHAYLVLGDRTEFVVLVNSLVNHSVHKVDTWRHSSDALWHGLKNTTKKFEMGFIPKIFAVMKMFWLRVAFARLHKSALSKWPLKRNEWQKERDAGFAAGTPAGESQRNWLSIMSWH